MGVELSMTYDGQLYCTATHDQSGSTIETEAPLDNGGKGERFSPTDLVGVAAGTCVLTIMGLVAQRNDLDITGTTCHVTKEMASNPRRIALLDITVTLPPGLALTPEQKQKLEKGGDLCPVKRSLHPDTELRLAFVYP